MLTTIAIDGTDLETLGLELNSVEALHSVVKRTLPAATLPLVPGQITLGLGVQYDPRRIPLRLNVNPSSFTDRQTKLDAITNQFAGPVAVTRVDSPTRALTARLEQIDVTTPFRVFANAAVYADLALICDDPFYYDTTPVSTSISAGSAGAISMGTGPTHKLTYSIAPCTNPVVILRDQSAVEVQRMTFTGTIPGGKTLDVNCALGPTGYTILQNSGATNRIDWLGSGETFFYLELVPGVTGYTLECAQAALTVSHYRSYRN